MAIKTFGESIRKYFARFVMPVGEYRANPIVLADGEQAPVALNSSGQLQVDAVVNVGDISVGVASDGATGAAVPASAGYQGFADAGGLLRGGRAYNVNSLGAEYVQGVNLRFVTAGASAEAGTLATPFHVIVDSGGGGGQAEGTNGAAAPGFSVQIGGTDGANLQPFPMIEGDTGGGDWTPQFVAMFPAPGGAVPAGTAANPLSVNVLSGGGSNASVGATGAAVPASATFVGVQSSTGTLIPLRAYPDSTAPHADPLPGFVLWGTRTGNYEEIGSATSPLYVALGTEGANGSAAPLWSTQVGGLDTTGDLASFKLYPHSHGNSTDQLPFFGLRGTRGGAFVELGTATNPIYITGGGGGGSAEGTIGNAAPVNANQAGGTDSAGNLVPFVFYPQSHGNSTAQLPAFALRGTRAGNFVELGTATNPIYVTGGGGGGASEGIVGDPAPTSASLGGGVDAAGNLRPVRAVDFDSDAGDDWLTLHGIGLPTAAGPVIGGTVTNPLSVNVLSGGGSNASVEATGAAVPASATYVGGNLGGNIAAPGLVEGNTGTAGAFPLNVVQLVEPGATGPVAIGTAGNPLAVDVISGGGSNASVGTNGAATPTSSTAIGGTDGTNLQQFAAINLNPSGSEFGLPISLRFVNAGGSTAAGTLAAPLRVDLTGTTTQPVNVVSSALPTGAAQEGTLSALNTKIPSQGQATMAGSIPTTIASNQTPIPVAGAAADDAAASGNPVLVAGKYVASPTAVSDGDVVTLRTDDLRNLFTRILGYDPSNDANRVQEVNPLPNAYAPELVASVAAAGGASGNNYYYPDMTAFRSLGLQFVLTPGTATLSVSIEGTCQDDGTAAASCTYSDMTEEIMGAMSLEASGAGTVSKIFVIDRLPVKFLRINVYQSGTTNGAWTIWARKVW